MKKLTIISVFVIMMANEVKAQGVFTSINLKSSGSQGTLSFTLPSEANVIHYRIEASNDNNTYEVLGTVISKGNSVFEKSYNCKVYNMDYKYYRVGRVAMNGSLKYSQVVCLPEIDRNSPYTEPILPAATIAVANSK